MGTRCCDNRTPTMTRTEDRVPLTFTELSTCAVTANSVSRPFLSTLSPTSPVDVLYPLNNTPRITRLMFCQSSEFNFGSAITRFFFSKIFSFFKLSYGNLSG